MKKFEVIDCDGHVDEPFSLYTEYCDPELRDRAPRRIERDGQRRVIVDGAEFPNFVRSGGRPLGMEADARIVRPLQKGPVSAGGVEPSVRLKDMDAEGIDVAVVFPSGTTSMCAIENAELESAMYRAYNRWLADYCAPDTGRLKGNICVSLRHPELAAREIRRVGAESWVAGIAVPAHIDDSNLDHPRFDPLWTAAVEHDLPVCIHAGAGRPPYAIGTLESSESLFLMHTMAHPFEQMRAIASLMGGGVFDRHPRLRIAFIESGIGWVAWWLDRLAEHQKNLPQHVPLMKRTPREYLTSGQVFISCLPEEETVEAVVGQMGDHFVVFASDYPHWDCGFPGTVQRMHDRKLPAESIARILGDNGRRLHTRIQ
jgi:predicted TIM-barrel fold metal-dependent hydrolase